MRFHGERLAVIGALGLYQHVARLRTAAGVHRFLQRRLVVHDRKPLSTLLAHLGQLRFQNVPQNETVSRFQAGIQI